MCKSLAIAHTCTHLIPFRLSTCRGTYEVPGLKPSRTPKPGCYSTPTIILISSTPCGACLQTSLQQQLEEDLAATKLQHSSGEVNGWGIPIVSPEAREAIAEAEENFERENWSLQRRFPMAQFKKFARPEKGVRVSGLTRRDSLLRMEVRREDVVEEEGWVSLEQELEERERENLVEVREFEAGVAAASKALFEGVEGDEHECTPLSPVEEEEEAEDQAGIDEGVVCAMPDVPAPASLADADRVPERRVRSNENQPPHPHRRAPDPPPYAKSAVPPPHLRRKAKVTSMRRKAKGQGEEFGDEWFKCMRTSLAVV